MEREVRISCPDATGLGCDVTRMLLDFGLRIVHGDMSTDGKWCFLIFRVSSLCSQNYSAVAKVCAYDSGYPTLHNSIFWPSKVWPAMKVTCKQLSGMTNSLSDRACQCHQHVGRVHMDGAPLHTHLVHACLQA